MKVVRWGASLFAVSMMLSCSLDELSGTSDSDDDGGGFGELGEQESPLSLDGRIKTFQNCAAAEGYFESKLIKRLKHRLRQRIKWIQKAHPESVANDQSSQKSASEGSSSPGSDSGGSPEDFTTTNNQVQGVEEADYLKNTGNHIYQLAAGRLQILKSWPAAEMKKLATLEFEGRPFQMLLAEEGRLVVMSHPPRDKTKSDYKNVSGGAVDTVGPARGSYDRSAVTVAVVDVSKPSSPKVKRRFRLYGRYQGARRIGSSIRVILQNNTRYPDSVTLSPEDSDYYEWSKAEKVAWYQAQHEKNKKAVRSKSLAYWLDAKRFRKVSKSGEKTPLLDLKSCKNIHAPTVDTRLGLTRLVTIDLNQHSADQTVLFSNVSQIYSSKKTIYMTTPYWWWNDKSKDTNYTFIHAFNIEKPDKAHYLGSGGVPGRVLNQFSMDEHKGHLRVATTVTRRPRRDGGRRWGDWSTFNRVSVMKLTKDQKLKVVGQTKKLAENEQIYSARFMGKRGFVVTFRRVDPLFTLNLSDPANPKVMGELKVPGFSTYIHMVGDSHLLTVGRDADPQSGVQGGIKISLFDVSDMKNPKPVHSKVLDGTFWSQAEWDHKAFTYFPARKTLAIPVTGREETSTSSGSWWEGYKSSLLIFHIDRNSGIKKAGELGMRDIYVDKIRPWGWWSSAARVSRSIFADDYVYAVSQLGIRAALVDDLQNPVSTVRYNCGDACYNYWYYY